MWGLESAARAAPWPSRRPGNQAASLTFPRVGGGRQKLSSVLAAAPTWRADAGPWLQRRVPGGRGGRPRSGARRAQAPWSRHHLVPTGPAVPEPPLQSSAAFRASDDVSLAASGGSGGWEYGPELPLLRLPRLCLLCCLQSPSSSPLRTPVTGRPRTTSPPQDPHHICKHPVPKCPHWSRGLVQTLGALFLLTHPRTWR